jgi:chromosome segregation ATPase
MSQQNQTPQETFNATVVEILTNQRNQVMSENVQLAASNTVLRGQLTELQNHVQSLHGELATLQQRNADLQANLQAVSAPTAEASEEEATG